MTAVAAVRSVRGILALGVGARALIWGAAAAGAVIVIGALSDLIGPLPLSARGSLALVAVLVGAGVASAMWWRARGVVSLTRVALWIEERDPSLGFALVTEVEGGRVHRSVATEVATQHWRRTGRARAIRALAVPLIALGAVALVLAVLPAGAVARVSTPRLGDALNRPSLGGDNRASRLTPLVADIVAPPYSRVPATSIDEPSSIRALVGSTVTIRGRGPADGIVAVAAAETLRARSSGDRWSITVPVARKPVALRLTDRAFARVVTVEPIVDAEPVVDLLRPARDSVLRTGTGRIPLSAQAHDDYGIVGASFEYIVSSGEGETFKFRQGIVGGVRPADGTLKVSPEASLLLDSLALKPGDIVHLRALVRDANVVTGPGIGASETRALRVARAGEYDSVAVEAAGPTDEDKSVVSQRMLIILAEALEKRRPSLPRPTVVSESRAIAADQTRLRKTVGEVIFTRLGGDAPEESAAEDVPARAKTMEELLRRADSATNISADPLDFAGGESPVVAVNKPLLEAYNAMWEAGTQLELGEPARALPHMRRALAAIQKARQAERIYLRGRPPRVVIDVNKVRLQGKDKGTSSIRVARPPLDSTQRAREERFARVVALASRDAAAAVDSLLLLRIDALDGLPSFAAALGDAADALRRNQRDRATDALVRARRALAGPAIVRDSLGRWGITP